jgi:hypothetical protein
LCAFGVIEVLVGIGELVATYSDDRVIERRRSDSAVVHISAIRKALGADRTC